MAAYAKAIVAGVIAALTSLVQALDDGNVSIQEGVAVALAGLIALAAVYGIPNKPPA